MRLLAAILALLTTTASLPAFALPRAEAAWSIERATWPEVGSPFISPLGQLLAQSGDSVAGKAGARELDQELAALTQERRLTRVTGPVVVTSIGLGMLVGGAALAWVSVSACDDARNDPTTDCNESAKDTLVIVFGIVAGVGALMAISGGTVWSSRLAKRRNIDLRMRELRDKRRSLGDSLASLQLGARA